MLNSFHHLRGQVAIFTSLMWHFTCPWKPGSPYCWALISSNLPGQLPSSFKVDWGQVADMGVQELHIFLHCPKSEGPTLDVNTLNLKPLFHFIYNVLENRPKIMKMPSVTALCIIYFSFIEHVCTTKAFPSDVHRYINPATVPPPFWAKPLENIPCVCHSRSRRLMQRPFKVIFFIWKLQMKCMPQKQFHLSPNEAFTDPVSKLWCNKLLPANINEICSLVAKQVNPSMTVFHDQVRGKRSSQSFMQHEGSGWWGITTGSFKMKMCYFQKKKMENRKDGEEKLSSSSSPLFGCLISMDASVVIAPQHHSSSFFSSTVSNIQNKTFLHQPLLIRHVCV